MQNLMHIAIITIAEHPCAQYLSANIVKNNVNVLLLSQNKPKYQYLSKDSLSRLLRQRGFITFIDNWLLMISKKRLFRKFLGAQHPSNGRYVKKIKTNFRIWNDDTWKSNLDNIEVVKTENVNSPETISILDNYKPDVIFLAGAPIISARIINIPRFGTINPHYGITPKYAGNTPYIWALFDNCPNEIGYTIHYAVPQVDSGTIIEQRRLPWRTDWTWDVLDKYLLQVMYDRYLEIAEKIISNDSILVKRQEVHHTNPPAGYITRTIAEQHKAHLYHNGIKLVNDMLGDDDLDGYLKENFANILGLPIHENRDVSPRNMDTF